MTAWLSMILHYSSRTALLKTKLMWGLHGFTLLESIRKAPVAQHDEKMTSVVFDKSDNQASMDLWRVWEDL